MICLINVYDWLSVVNASFALCLPQIAIYFLSSVHTHTCAQYIHHKLLNLIVVHVRLMLRHHYLMTPKTTKEPKCLIEVPENWWDRQVVQLCNRRAFAEMILPRFFCSARTHTYKQLNCHSIMWFLLFSGFGNPLILEVSDGSAERVPGKNDHQPPMYPALNTIIKRQDQEEELRDRNSHPR